MTDESSTNPSLYEQEQEQEDDSYSPSRRRRRRGLLDQLLIPTLSWSRSQPASDRDARSSSSSTWAAPCDHTAVFPSLSWTDTTPLLTKTYLLGLLQAVRVGDANVQRIQLQGSSNSRSQQQPSHGPRLLPPAYVTALLQALTRHSQHVRHLTLSRVMMLSHATATTTTTTTNATTNTTTADQDEPLAAEAVVSVSSSTDHSNTTTDHQFQPSSSSSSVRLLLHALTNYMQTSRTLTHLDLSHNGLTAAAATWLAAGLTGNPYRVLRRLDVQGNQLGDAGVVLLVSAIQSSSSTSSSSSCSSNHNNNNHNNNMSSIAVLKLGRNQLGAVAVQAIADLLDWQGQQLEQQQQQQPSNTLDANNNNNNNNNHTTDWHFIHSIDLRGNHLGASASLLATALSRPHCRLQSLYLNRNNLDSTVIRHMATALHTNRHLRTLDLQRNPQVDNVAAQYLWIALQQYNHVVRKLKLRHTGVGLVWRNELLQVLLMNAHGPELARQTKEALGRLVALQQQQQQQQPQQSDEVAVEEGGGGAVKHPTNMLRSYKNWSLMEQDETERTTLLEDDDDENGVEWIESWAARTTAAAPPAECVICYNPIQPVAALLLPCTHYNCCWDCGQRLKDCHMCRHVVVQVWPLATARPLSDGLYLTPNNPTTTNTNTNTYDCS